MIENTQTTIGNVWVEMGRRLAVVFPRWVIARLEARSNGKGFAVKAIPFVIVFLSVASIANLAGRAYVHHSDFSAYMTGAGIAVLVPIAVLAAMLIDGSWAYVFWCMALVFAGISGTIQFNIYLLQDDSWLAIAEAAAFGFGVPISEVMLAIMEARLVIQIDRNKGKAEAEQAATMERQRAEDERKAEAERQRVENERIAEDERQARLQREAEDREFEQRKREAELRAYEAELAQRTELEREKTMATLRIKERKAAVKIDSRGDSGNDSKNQKGVDYERAVISYFAKNPRAPQRKAAEDTGISQAKISKTLKSLESQEIIHRNGNGVEILKSL